MRLLRLCLTVFAVATPAARAEALTRFLETVSAYGSSDVRTDLEPALSALQAR